MDPLNPVETLTLVGFCTAITQFAKELGVQGKWPLRIVCVVAGAAFTYITTYQPELWHSLQGLILAVTATGNVALVKDLRQ